MIELAGGILLGLALVYGIFRLIGTFSPEEPEYTPPPTSRLGYYTVPSKDAPDAHTHGDETWPEVNTERYLALLEAIRAHEAAKGADSGGDDD